MIVTAPEDWICIRNFMIELVPLTFIVPDGNDCRL